MLLTIESDYQLDLRDGDFSGLISFNKRVVNKTTYSDRLPDINRVWTHFSPFPSDSIVSGKATDESGKATDVVFDFSVENV